MALYLTKQAPVAWEYAQWAKQFFDVAVVPVGILTIAVPNNLLPSRVNNIRDEIYRENESVLSPDLPLTKEEGKQGYLMGWSSLRIWSTNDSII